MSRFKSRMLFAASLFFCGRTYPAFTSATNKTYYQQIPLGRELYAEHIGWHRARRKADLKEAFAPGISIQAGCFANYSRNGADFAPYFGASGKGTIIYGQSLAEADRSKVDLAAENIVHNPYVYSVFYNQSKHPQIFSLLSKDINTTSPDQPYGSDWTSGAGQTVVLTKDDLDAAAQSFSTADLNPVVDDLGTLKFDVDQNSNFPVMSQTASLRYLAGLEAFKANSSTSPKGSISIAPELIAWGCRMNFYVNVSELFWAKLNVPLVRVKRDLHLTFVNSRDVLAKALQGTYSVQYKAPISVSPGATFYDEGTDKRSFFSEDFSSAHTPDPAHLTDFPQLPGNLRRWANYRKIPAYNVDSQNNTSAQMALDAIKLWTGQKTSDFGFGDIDFFIGRRLIDCKDYDLGVFVVGTLPGSQGPTGEFLFEPIRGNGKHFELGFGLEANGDIVSLKDWSIEAFATVCARYGFRAREIRTVGAKLDSSAILPWQHYFLVAKVGSAGSLIPLANITTGLVDVTPGFSFEGFCGLSFAMSNLFFDAGCSFYARETEKVEVLRDIFGGATYAFVDPYDYKTFEISDGTNRRFSPENTTAINLSKLDGLTASTPAQLVSTLFFGVGYADPAEPLGFSAGFGWQYSSDSAVLQNWSLHLKASFAM